jgi:hypothetical protein
MKKPKLKVEADSLRLIKLIGPLSNSTKEVTANYDLNQGQKLPLSIIKRD